MIRNIEFCDAFCFFIAVVLLHWTELRLISVTNLQIKAADISSHPRKRRIAIVGVKTVIKISRQMPTNKDEDII